MSLLRSIGHRKRHPTGLPSPAGKGIAPPGSRECFQRKPCPELGKPVLVAGLNPVSPPFDSLKRKLSKSATKSRPLLIARRVLIRCPCPVVAAGRNAHGCLVGHMTDKACRSFYVLLGAAKRGEFTVEHREMVPLRSEMQWVDSGVGSGNGAIAS